jgi:hypothetical protein
MGKSGAPFLGYWEMNDVGWTNKQDGKGEKERAV